MEQEATLELDSAQDIPVDFDMRPFLVVLMVHLDCRLERIAMVGPLCCLLVLLLEDHPYLVGLPYLDSVVAFLPVEVLLLKVLRSSMVNIEEQQLPLPEERHQPLGQTGLFYLNNC